MAKMSFSDETVSDAAPEVELPKVSANEETSSKPLATTPSPSAPAIYVESEDAEGEFSSRDIQWPNLSIVTKTSAEAETFGIGTWLVNKETPVGKMTEPINLVAVKIQKAYQEQLPFGSGVRPRMFRTIEEATNAGLSLDWHAEARCAEVLGIRFWLQQPEGVDAPHVFILDGPEGPGTIVKFFAARTTYGTVGKNLIKAKQTYMRNDKGGLVSGWWKMTATKETKNGNTWLLPRIVPGGKTSPELAAFLRDLSV
jgi:hypothetical protein